MERIAVIGLGAMGAPIAHRLLGQGCQVTGWNRSPRRAAALREAGGAVGVSPADAVRGAEAVLVMVTGPQALLAVTEGEHGIAAGIDPGAVVVQMSTVSPSSLTRLAQALPAGTGLLDAPVLGSVAEAASGALRILAGGPPELVERCLPLLTRLGSPLRVGELGAGTAAKLVANNALFGVLGVLGESLALGGALGLSWEVLHEVLGVTPLAEQAARRRPVIEADDYPARFALALARKDADLVADAVGDAGLTLGLTAASRDWLAAAEGAGRADQDYTAVLAAILHAAGKEPRR
ncbi:NAD(P)-dependent oxidoreductase [Kitasatospora sp. NBC_01287]|uniref:NAD(P)-dependent oxidoreductase n=1 Tax=Kitasatospora sp. NBC_01287 TaxID=2903573 RepID=UPI00225224AF|nr:NAD(P)-dependent oxidoreductase [Kitasatospora sp. NBC_01287]MCX4745594.1 NAD(P)-dependent oxidoreductase [Kitasatospora sp. NBC_01287]